MACIRIRWLDEETTSELIIEVAVTGEEEWIQHLPQTNAYLRLHIGREGTGWGSSAAEFGSSKRFRQGGKDSWIAAGRSRWHGRKHIGVSRTLN